MEENRRRFIQAIGAGSVGLLAGCSGGGGDDETTTEGPGGTTSGGKTTSGGGSEITPESVIHQKAGGKDIWDKLDLGHFYYAEYSGDFDVRVKVHSVEQGVSEYAKGGIMFRNSMESDDVHVMTRRGPAGYSNVQWRPEKGSNAGSLTSDIGDGKAKLDKTFWAWHRLVREGDTVKFHVSDNGEDWQLMAELTSDDVNLADEGLLGLAATSHNQAQAVNIYYTGFEGVTPTTAEDLGGPVVSGSVEILDEMPDDIDVPEEPEQTTTTEPEPEAELVNHFTFDGDTITDEVSGDTGSMGGGVSTGASGKAGSAFQFDGEDDYATFPGTSLNGEQATVTGWFNVSAHQDWSRVLQVGGAYDRSPGEGDTTGGWDLEFEGPTKTLTVTTYGPKERPTAIDIEYDTWYFSAVVVDGQNVTWHLFDSDGKVDTVSNEQVRTVLDEAPITFFAGDEHYTAGMIDDVRGFNGALSEDRITSIYEEA